jgi:hypothetical protein
MQLQHEVQIVTTEQLQHYMLQKLRFRYRIVNTLHKGDNKYNNNNNNNVNVNVVAHPLSAKERNNSLKYFDHLK